MGGLLHVVASGSCIIDANQPGNSAYDAAPEVARKFPILSADGSGTLTTSTTTVSASSSRHTIVFTYGTASGGILNGAVRMVVPSGWSTPSTTTTDAGATTASVGTVSVSGRTITVSGLTQSSRTAVKITYGSPAAGGPGATAPSTAVGAQTWKASEKSTSGGTLRALSASPQITVTAGAARHR
jgi:hypothetical protein